MSRWLHLVFLPLLACPIIESRSYFSFQRQVPDQIRPEALRTAIERGLLSLSLGLERASNSLEAEENTVIAPLSVAAIAALLLAGAEGVTRTELETLFGVQNMPYSQEEMHKTLASLFSRLETNDQIEQNLSYGSGLFVQEGEPISANYLKMATEIYRSEVISVDFRKASFDTSLLINKWVSNRTEGKIPSLLDDIVDPATSMIIASVFYFKGSWEQPFVEKFTKTQKFYVSKKETIAVPLMVSMINAYFSKVRGSHTILGLPYKGGDITMYFVLPDGDLRKFVNSLNTDSIQQFVNQTVRQQTIVAIPRMRVEGTLELSGPMSSLGVSSLFRPRSANLSGIGKGFYVSEMLHKVSIEITETGTVGAAASAVTILRDGSTPLFRADRPFLFFIYHQATGTILFWGTVFKPQAINDS